MLTDPAAVDAGTGRLHPSCGLVPEHDRERYLDLARHDREVTLADTCGVNPDEDLSRAGFTDAHVVDDLRRRAVEHCSSH
ncbi:hypothetical protein GCM10023175_64950 [Pseudonocardia xishanensis]|uniref:Uncharacterized protein n=1 Tax=Pseudonocardia xishanensis TaxID=630995 RepID=A0ABP8S2A4_9PSEU